jgi:molybdate transport system ATP-binding protein
VTLDVDVTHEVGAVTLAVRLRCGPGITTLMGPSGAGKSLTLSIVAGLVRPQRGTVRIGGRLVADAAAGLHVPTQDRRVGMAFQHTLLLPHRSALDNVALAVREGSRAQRRRVAHGWLERVGAAPLAARSPRSLSGGERQRVSVARALASSPDLLLLDEPFSALDHDSRDLLRSLVQDEVTRRRIPAVFVTHEPDEAGALGEEVVVMEAGTVAAVRRVAGPARR